LFALLLAVSFGVRWPFRSVSLNRDEGEYVHLAQEILRGRIPYLDVYNQKTPVVFYLMAGVQKVAGIDPIAVRVFTAFYGLLATTVLYLLARRLFGYPTALWAALAFCVMTFDQCGTDHPSSAEFFMLLWMLIALDFWYLGLEGRRWWMIFLAGVAAGLAYQTKQTGLVVLVFFFAERLMHGLRQWRTASWAILFGLRDSALAATGFALVLAVILGYFASQGAWQAYVECTWTNNWQYVNQRAKFVAAPIGFLITVVQQMARWDIGLWILGAAGLGALACRRAASAGRDLWLLLLLSAGAAIKAGHFYVHYYEPLIVPLALGCGVAAAWLWRQACEPTTAARRFAAALLLLAPWGWPAVYYVSLLTMSASELASMCYPEPFTIAADVGRYLAQRTSPQEAVLVLGSEPEIYFYAQRPSAARMAIMYPMIAPYTYSTALRESFLAQWKARTPRYVVFAASANSYSEWQETVPQFILHQIAPILRKNYALEKTFSLAKDHVGGSQNVYRAFLVFRRRTECQ
jgi:4-amino-4-deoxy-L-arabinose transferase-like glycosyltransferase